jgi:ketosteroid isomerase-like protein
MNTNNPLLLRMTLAFTITILALGGPVHANETPEATVEAFNAAISARDLAGATGHFADGAVQFTLRPAHAGMAASAPQGLSMDLKAHWTQVGSLLFSVTKSYTRTPTITDTRIDGDLATVWAQLATETLERSAAEARRERFAEVYLLVRKQGNWLIAGVADNRGATRPGGIAPAGAAR